MAETEIKCPYCGRECPILDTDGDIGSNHELIYCIDCEMPISIGTGEVMKDWYEEALKQKS